MYIVQIASNNKMMQEKVIVKYIINKQINKLLMASTHTAKCKWCGRTYKKANNALMFIKLGSDYCSKQCETSATESKGVSASRNLEAENMKAQLDFQERQAKEQKEKEDKARRQEKAAELKLEDKPYMAFFTEYGQNVYLGVLIPIFAIIFLIMTGANDNDKSYLLYIGVLLAVIFLTLAVFILNKLAKEYFRK
jgi:Flp pilus assembly protein TadB